MVIDRMSKAISCCKTVNTPFQPAYDTAVDVQMLKRSNEMSLMISFFFVSLVLTVVAIFPNNKHWHLQRILQRGPLTERDIRTGRYAFDLNKIHAQKKASIIAYIVDSGIHIQHVEFEGRAEYGINTLNKYRMPDDCNGHGTHVAGLVGGRTTGVAPTTTLVAVRVLDCDGFGSCSQLGRGLRWVLSDIERRTSSQNFSNTSKHASSSRKIENSTMETKSTSFKEAQVNKNTDRFLRFVVVMSVGSSSPSCAVTEKLAEELWRRNVTVVAASGNKRKDCRSVYPVRSAHVLGVGATDSRDFVFKKNNHGPCVDIFAPGVNLISAWVSGFSDNTFVKKSGSSMATPLVAGVVALILRNNPSFTPSDVKRILLSSATRGALSSDNGSSVLPGTNTPNKLLFAPWSQLFNSIRRDQIDVSDTPSWEPSHTWNETVDGHKWWNKSATFTAISFSIEPASRPTMEYMAYRAVNAMCSVLRISSSAVLIRRAASCQKFKNGSEPNVLRLNMYVPIAGFYLNEFRRRWMNQTISLGDSTGVEGFTLNGGQQRKGWTEGVGVPKGVADWVEEGPSWFKIHIPVFVVGVCLLVLMFSTFAVEISQTLHRPRAMLSSTGPVPGNSREGRSQDESETTGDGHSSARHLPSIDDSTSYTEDSTDSEFASAQSSSVIETPQIYFRQTETNGQSVVICDSALTVK